MDSEFSSDAPSNWQRLTVDEVCNRVTSGGTPSRRCPDYFTGDIPWVKTKELNDCWLRDTEEGITDDALRNSSAKLLPENTVLIAMYGATTSMLGLLSKQMACNQACCALIVNSSKAYFRFVYYQLLAHRKQLKNLAIGAAQQNLNARLIRNFRLAFPPLAEQHIIAYILGTLDDKIELNRRMNRTLEGMAQALFKSMFVDFDGQDDFVDSKLGAIPRGWTAGSFGDIITQRSERVGNREVIVLSAVTSGKLVRSDDYFTKRVYSKKTTKYLVVEQWDFAYNPSRINIGSIGMLEEEILGGMSPVYIVARPKPAYQWFLEFSIKRIYTKEWIDMLASGTVRQSLSYTDFASIPNVIPPEAVVQKFNRNCAKLRKSIKSHENESRTLASLRDTLLPKLISGELRVPDAEKIMEVAS